MLVTWLIEIYLNQLGELKEQGQDMSLKYDSLQEEFRKFLAHQRVQVGVWTHGGGGGEKWVLIMYCSVPAWLSLVIAWLLQCITILYRSLGLCGYYMVTVYNHSVFCRPLLFTTYIVVYNRCLFWSLANRYCVVITW